MGEKFLANLLLFNVNCQGLASFDAFLENILVGIDVGFDNFGMGLVDVINQLEDADSIEVLYVIVEGCVVCSVHCSHNLVAYNGDSKFICVPILAEDCVSCYKFGTLVCVCSSRDDWIIWQSCWDVEGCTVCCSVLGNRLEEPGESFVVTPWT